MAEAGIILSVLGILVTAGIAFFQYRKAKEAERRYEALLHSLPKTLLEGVGGLLRNSGLIQGVEWSEPGSKSENSPWLQTRFADLDGDGKDELLVDLISGPHSTALLVFSAEAWGFKQVAELYSTTGLGFDVEDVDHDGKLEVETVEVALRPGLPYAFGLRDRVTHKLVDGQFVEVKRVEGWDESDLERIRSESEQDAKRDP